MSPIKYGNERINVILDSEVKRKLDYLAALDHRSVNNLISKILTSYVMGIERTMKTTIDDEDCKDEEELFCLFMKNLATHYNKEFANRINFVMAEICNEENEKNKD